MPPSFLTINPPPSPFHLSPPLSPKSDISHDNDVSPITPELRDSFPVSGFPQSSSFNFDIRNSIVSPVSPPGERRSRRFSLNLIPNRRSLNRSAPDVVVIPPGGVYRERGSQASVEAPPPYERYSRPMPGSGITASRSSIAAGQFPTGPAFPASVHGYGRHSRFVSAGGAARSFSGQRQLYPLTLADTRGGASQPPKKASWRIFGSVDAIDRGMEKKPLTKKGKWFIYIIVATILITVAIVGALVGTMRSKGSGNSAKADSLSGFPELPTGMAVVIPQDVPETPSSACVLPATLWSCNLPPDTTFPTNSSRSGTTRLPTFEFTISVKNAASDSDPPVRWAPTPDRVPNDTEYASLADVDNIKSNDKSGEQTPFYFSMRTDQNTINTRDIETADSQGGKEALVDQEHDNSAESSTGRRRQRRFLSKRQESQIPALMLPITLLNQPLRLFDRGLDTEHYGFFVYYKKTIHVLAADPSEVTELTAASDANGGVSALVSNNKLVTWENTRFKVSIWTQGRTNGQMDLINNNGQRMSSEVGAFDNVFPYPVSVTEDRNGDKGDVFYGKNFQARTIVKEEEGKSCFCEWRNWRVSIN